MLVDFLPSSRLPLLHHTILTFECVDCSLVPCRLAGSAALRFQPTRRPQLPAQKPKSKPTLPKAAPAAGAAAPAPAPASAPTATAPVSSLADWADDDDVNGFYAGEKRQRGGRKKRKKNQEAQFVQNWDDIYDPSRPNNYEEYKHSDEQIAEVREWKDRLYAHRMARSASRDSLSDEERSRPMNRMYFSEQMEQPKLLNRLLGQFAPPSSFAPPPNLNDIPRDVPMPDYTQLPPPPPEEPPAPIPNDPTGDDAYARRLQMSGIQPPVETGRPPPQPMNTIQPPSATISRAPVRYTLPPPPEDIPASEAELEEVFAKEKPAGEEEEQGEGGQRSLRPGQKGFAERLLSKYGWTKGSGLGATGSGIVNPLQVKVEKQKKRPDSEGGGFATPAGRGKIVDGARKKEEEGKFGAMSEVIVLKGMLNGMDLDAELEGDQDGGLMQEIGEECSEKVGHCPLFDWKKSSLTRRSTAVLSVSTFLVIQVHPCLFLSSSLTNYRLYG